MLILAPLVSAIVLWFATHKYFFVLAAGNLTATACFAIDKFKAKKNKWRFREVDLVLLCVFFPFGSLLGISAFRHKSAKLKFWLTAALFGLLQTGGYFWWRWTCGQAKQEALWTLLVMTSSILVTAGREAAIRLKWC